MIDLKAFREAVEKTLDAEDVVGALEKQGVRRNVAVAVAQSSGVKGRRSVMQQAFPVQRVARA